MANNMYNMCLVGAMDRLWFHQIILFSQPTNISLITPQNSIEEDQPIWLKSESPSLSTSSLEDDLKDGDYETDLSFTTDELDSPPKFPKQERPRRRSTSFNTSRNRSHSSLSPTDERKLIRRLSSSTPRLEKSMSCRSLGELELEELKGVLDLGFTFKKENLSPRMMSLIPGLQRLNSLDKSPIGEDDEEETSGLINRPYLSEAWLIKRPSSPLLNIRVPRLSEASDMKKHLRFWARTVASEVQQES